MLHKLLLPLVMIAPAFIHTDDFEMAGRPDSSGCAEVVYVDGQPDHCVSVFPTDQVRMDFDGDPPASSSWR